MGAGGPLGGASGGLAVEIVTSFVVALAGAVLAFVTVVVVVVAVAVSLAIVATATAVAAVVDVSTEEFPFDGNSTTASADL